MNSSYIPVYILRTSSVQTVHHVVAITCAPFFSVVIFRFFFSPYDTTVPCIVLSFAEGRARRTSQIPQLGTLIR